MLPYCLDKYKHMRFNLITKIKQKGNEANYLLPDNLFRNLQL